MTNIQKQLNGGRIVFSKNGTGVIGYRQVKVNRDLNFTPHVKEIDKENSKWNINLTSTFNFIKL